MRRLAAAIKKEFLQFKRDRMLLILILWTYTIEVILCTVALSFNVKDLRIAIYDTERSQMSQRLIERFTASEYFSKAVYVSGADEINSLMDAGRVDMGVIIPDDFSERIEEGRQAHVQFNFGNTNPNTVNAALAYSRNIMERFSSDAVSARMVRMGYALPRGVEPRIRVWFNPELEFRYFMVISMIVVACFMVGMIHPAATLVREKETGTVEQLMVTPLSAYEIIISKLLPTITIAMLSLFPSLLIAKIFGVPIKGSIFLFFIASALFLLTSMGIGTYISTFSSNLQQALLISFFILFPLMFLSGTIVPIRSMPVSLQYVSYASPVRYYMEISLGIFLKGVGLDVLWPKFLLLFIFGAVIFLLSLRKLKF
jgi:ABC-2 type transport system permease protein